MSSPAQHRRFRLPRIRFSLKTAFVLITALCVWLAYNVYVVQHRKVLRRMITENHLLLWEYDEQRFWIPVDHVMKYDPDKTQARTTTLSLEPSKPIRVELPEPQISLVRRWLGDVSVVQIVLADDHNLDSIRAAFSEAKVVVLPGFEPDKD